MTRNHSIDILRCVFAFMVVYLHTHYWIGYPMDLCRCAVPGFMVMTGYFVWSKDKVKQDSNFLKSAKHHLVIYSWSLLLYGLLTVRDSWKNRDFSWLSLEDANNFYVFGELDFLYFGFHLWYLHAVIYALLILWGLSKIDRLKCLVWLTPIFLLINLEFFKHFVKPIVGSYHLPTYITYGIPFLFIGMTIRKYEGIIRKKFKYSLFPLLTVFLTSLYFERLLLEEMGIKANDKYVSTIILVVLLIVLCVVFSTSKENIVAKIGRKYSLDIYVFHNFMLFLYYSICDKLPPFINEYAFKYASPILIFLATLLFVIIFRAINSKISVAKYV